MKNFLIRALKQGMGMSCLYLKCTVEFSESGSGPQSRFHGTRSYCWPHLCSGPGDSRSCLRRSCRQGEPLVLQDWCVTAVTAVESTFQVKLPSSLFRRGWLRGCLSILKQSLKSLGFTLHSSLVQWTLLSTSHNLEVNFEAFIKWYYMQYMNRRRPHLNTVKTLVFSLWINKR